MKIGLVNPGNYTKVDEREVIPLGLLSLAAIAESMGHQVEIVSINQFLLVDQDLKCNEFFPERISEMLAEKSFDVLGFSTMTDNLPLVIEIAKQYKFRCADIPIVLGGPGATFIDRDILDAFSFIDIIARGEGERTFAELLSALEHQKNLSNIKGVTLRERRGKITRTPNRNLIKNIDDLPIPAYHLISEILNRPEIKSMNVSVGRGCPNNCSFCSTVAFWSTNVRMHSPERVIKEMSLLNQNYAINEFGLVHDNVFAHKKWVLSFCKLFREKLPHAKFFLSASINFCSPRIIREVARSGCIHIYMGLETASEKTAKNLSKKFADPVKAEKKISIIRKKRIQTTRSYIVGFPDESFNDINQTIMSIIEMQASASVYLIENTQLHPLCILPGTLLYRKHKDCLSYSYNDEFNYWRDKTIVKINPCLELCKKYPKIFTTYATHHNENKHSKITELCQVFLPLILISPRSLFIALRELELSPFEFLERLKDYVSTNMKNPTNNEKGKVFKWPEDKKLLTYFFDFLPEIYQSKNCSQDFAKLVWNYEIPKLTSMFNTYNYVNLHPIQSLDIDSMFEFVPIIPKMTVLLSLEYDPDRLFAMFRLHGKRSTRYSNRKTSVFYGVGRNNYNTQPSGSNEYSVWYMKRSTRILFWKISQLVDGKRSCFQIADELACSLGFSNRGSLASKRILTILRDTIKSGLLMLSGEVADVPLGTLKPANNLCSNCKTS